MTQRSSSPTSSPLKKKQCPEDKDDPINEDDKWCEKFKEVDGGASTQAEGIQSTTNIENND